MSLTPRQQRLADLAIDKAFMMRTRTGSALGEGDLPRLTIQTLPRNRRITLVVAGVVLIAVGLATIILWRSDCTGLTLVTLGLIAAYFGIVGVHRSVEEIAQHAKDNEGAFMDRVRSGVFADQ